MQTDAQSLRDMIAERARIAGVNPDILTHNLRRGFKFSAYGMDTIEDHIKTEIERIYNFGNKTIEQMQELVANGFYTPRKSQQEIDRDKQRYGVEPFMGRAI